MDVRAVRLHTKCDHTLEYFDFTAADALGSFSATTQRLRGCGASLHAMRIHDPSEKRDNGKGMAANGAVDDIAMAVSPGGHVAGLVSLREQHKISQVSIGMMADGMPGEQFRSTDTLSKDANAADAPFSFPLRHHRWLGLKLPAAGNGRDNRSDAITRLMRDAPAGSFDSALLAGGWNLLNQEGLEAFAEAEKRGIEVHNAAIFASGLLAGGVTYLYSADRVTDELRRRTDAWSDLAAEHGLSLPAVAVAFAALPACVTKVVIGLSTLNQLQP